MKKIFLIIVMFIFLSGCLGYIPKNQTIEDVVQTNTKTYKNVKKQDLQEAIAKVIRLSKDSFQTNISANDDNLYIKVQENPAFIIGFARIITNINFNFQNLQDNNVKINIYQHQSVYSSTLFIMNNYDEYVMTNAALNNLIFKRVDYFLGLSDKWYTCDEYDKYIKEYNISGSTEIICLFADDYTPTSKQGQKILTNFEI